MTGNGVHGLRASLYERNGWDEMPGMCQKTNELKRPQVVRKGKEGYQIVAERCTVLAFLLVPCSCLVSTVSLGDWRASRALESVV